MNAIDRRFTLAIALAPSRCSLPLYHFRLHMYWYVGQSDWRRQQSCQRQREAGAEGGLRGEAGAIHADPSAACIRSNKSLHSENETLSKVLIHVCRRSIKGSPGMPSIAPVLFVSGGPQGSPRLWTSTPGLKRSRAEDVRYNREFIIHLIRLILCIVHRRLGHRQGEHSLRTVKSTHTTSISTTHRTHPL